MLKRMIIEVIIRYRQTDRQTNSLTPYTGVCGFFLQVKFATSLLASLAGDKYKNLGQSPKLPRLNNYLGFYTSYIACMDEPVSDETWH